MSRPTQVLVQNTGATGSATTYANPAAVPAGVIAAFTEAGVGIDMSAAAPAKYQLVLGHATNPIISPLITKANSSAYKLDYVAPVRNSITITGFPVGPTGGAVYTIGVANLNAAREQFPRTSFSEDVLASATVSATIDAFITAMNAANRQDFFTARSNLALTVTLTGTSGTANVTVDGTAYLATFDTDLATTAGNFVTAHAATILSTHNINVTNPSGAILRFERLVTVTGGSFTAVSANVSGDLDGTDATAQAQTGLILDGAAVDDILELAFDDHLATVTMTETATAMVIGSGSSAQILALEQKARGTTGRYYAENQVLGSLADPPTFSVDGTNYDMYTIQHQNDQDDNINRSFKHAEIVLAFATAVTGTLNTFLGVS